MKTYLIMPRYNISDPNEYLVLTGAGIDEIRITKKAFVMPWQKVRIIPGPPAQKVIC